jgi:hypothetical protein
VIPIRDVRRDILARQSLKLLSQKGVRLHTPRILVVHVTCDDHEIDRLLQGDIKESLNGGIHRRIKDINRFLGLLMLRFELTPEVEIGEV